MGRKAMFSNPIHWRLRRQRYRLAGTLCLRCEDPLFPPRLLCRDCVERQQEAQVVNFEIIIFPDPGQRVESIPNLHLPFA